MALWHELSLYLAASAATTDTLVREPERRRLSDA